jgi:hypothetical protein
MLSWPTHGGGAASASVGRRRGQAVVVDVTTPFRRGLPIVDALVAVVV